MKKILPSSNFLKEVYVETKFKKQQLQITKWLLICPANLLTQAWQLLTTLSDIQIIGGIYVECLL